MTSNEFIAWAMEQPEMCRYELIEGGVLPMAPERSAHTRTKAHIWRRLTEAIEVGRLACEAFVDRMAIEIDNHTVYEPDAAVRCGVPLPHDAIKLGDPVIVVEVQSPSTSPRDVGIGLIDHFRLPTENGIIPTRIIHDAPILLDSPDITLTDCFPPGVVRCP